MRPRLLDLCCRAGGAGAGYITAGYDVTGVDIVDRSAVYPGRFVQTDALAFLAEHGSEFDFIHASWPCQAHSTLTKGTNKGGTTYEDLIPEGRRLLQASGRPWVIENVAGAPIAKHLMLCGEMFGLAVLRHRFFEFSDATMAPKITHPAHRGRVSGWNHGQWHDGPYFAVYGAGGGKGTVADWQSAMGIDWTADRMDLAEAIPPAYTAFIGRHIISSASRAAG